MTDKNTIIKLKRKRSFSNGIFRKLGPATSDPTKKRCYKQPKVRSYNQGSAKGRVL